MSAGFLDVLAAENSREISVFINCPFDDDFAPLRDGLVFATVCCGLVPRVAMDLGNTDVPRIERILIAIAECRYSIHDLSRCKGGGDENLARFNMPLELGIAMAHKHAAMDGQEHDWLTLVPGGHEYVRFVSDLAGFDPHQHDESVEAVVRTGMAWLWTLETAIPAHRPDDVVAALPKFTAARQQLDLEFASVPPWSEVYEAAKQCVPEV